MVPDINGAASSYQSMFGIAVFITIFYAVLAIPAIKQIKSGTLGMNPQTGTKADFPHPQSIYNKLISTLGG